MEERLISRFLSGMVADIQPPELDTRIAILQKKAEQEGIHLHSEVAAVHRPSGQEQRAGAGGHAAAPRGQGGAAQAVHRSRSSPRRRCAPQSPSPITQTSVEDIQRATCDYFNIRLVDLKSHRRHRAVSFPRMVAMYLCRQRLNTSYPELGERFGGKDHTTVISAVRKISGLLDKDDSLRTAVEAIERKLGS